jgi:vesicle-fusing ATPase
MRLFCFVLFCLFKRISSLNAFHFFFLIFQGLVRSASSFALQRQIDPQNPTKPINPDAVRVTRDDFMHALQEVKPLFGVSEESIEAFISNGIINYGPAFAKLWDTINSFLVQVRNSNRTSLLSILLEGLFVCLLA